MSTNKDTFYKNRILWKAEKHKIKPTESTAASHITSKIKFDGEVVLSFLKSDDFWTIITTREVVSRYGGEPNRINLDSINGLIEIEPPPPPFEHDIKNMSEFLILGESATKIWSPSKGTLFAIISILKMFPLKLKSFNQK